MVKYKYSLFSLIMSFISLMIFWVIMSGLLDPIHLSMGAATVIGTIIFNYRLKTHSFFEDDVTGVEQLRYGPAFLYVFWIFWQMLTAGFHVATVILKPQLRMEVSIIKFKVDLPNEHAKMILGNSITLTPGTVTIFLEGDDFTVHSISPASHAGIISDEMPRKVLSLYSKDPHPDPVVTNVQIISGIQK